MQKRENRVKREHSEKSGMTADEQSKMHEAFMEMRERNHIKTVQTGKNRTYRLDIYGCQMNERDAETCAGFLDDMGFQRVGEGNPADVVLFVTCCVRETAEDRIFGHLGRLSKECKEDGSYVISGGCMMQQPHIVDRIKKSYPQVKVVFGTHNLHRLPELMLHHESRNKRVFEVWEEAKAIIEDLPVGRSDPYKAWVNIAYGCNNFCTYCIVPHVRGRERSRLPADVLTEIRDLASKGYLEITLLGQNVNSYGNDLGETDLFAKLLHEIEKIDGIVRVRFMTSHPKDLSPKLIEAMSECSKVCKQLHLPIQSGSNRILEKMNRKYTREHYLALVNALRTKMPGLPLSTDLIVGFPGETEEDFEQTCDLVKKVGFDFAFQFIYSQRKGTPAAEYDCQISEEIAGMRFRKLLELQNAITQKNAEVLEGTVQNVLVEGTSRDNPDIWSGRTETNRLVNFTAKHNHIGKIVAVTIIRATSGFWLEGSAVED
jgi:tRNA-2-methylthio-N6-dimethylallyladenosine synthase